MANLTVPDLVLRLIKGTPLTPEEMDTNLTTLRDFANALSNLIGQSLNSDGALKANTVNAAAIQSRVINLAHLDLKWLHLDTSATANIFTITPAPALTTYEDGLVFFVRAANKNTAACQVNVNGLGLKPLRKRGGLDLDANDILAGQVICVAYYGGAFELVATAGTGAGGTGSSGVGGGFSGFNTYTPLAVAMPVGPSYPYNFGVFLHGLAVVPTFVIATLVCETPELDYVTGQEVPIGEATDIDGDEAFIVKRDVNSITVTMAEAPCVRHATTGVITAITLASWKLKVFAGVITNAATVGFPALSYLVRNPMGVMSNGNDIFFAERRITGAVVTTHVNTTTGNVTKIAPAASQPDHNYINAAPFKRANGAGEFIFTANTGIYRMLMASPYGITRHGALDSLSVFGAVGGKPLQIVEDGGGALVQVLASGYLNGAVDTVSALNLYANVAYGPIAAGAVGSPMDLRDAFIKSADGTGGNVEFIGLTRINEGISGIQYNKLKKRLYVITSDTMLLHIFEINDAGFTEPGSFVEWWLHVNRPQRLLYKKTIAIAGAGDYVGTPYNEHFFIDHDVLTDGAERAIVFPRSGNATYGGSVTRVPWRE